MSYRTVSRTRIDRAGQDARTKIPAGQRGARALNLIRLPKLLGALA
ncbi:hypothetical protein [Methylobacterium sp. J-070]|nr:hypothetical protein [Methylobacterium sp. J-070]MCJ2053810.1 hypothetical protein [Methylobacterium sp. J-070]